LCNNTGLVSRLVDWEESWEVGQRYILNETFLSALCDLVAFIQHAQAFEPTLAGMCEDCDVELFLVLPRLLILRFLIAPAKQTELLKSLLPLRFLHGSSQPCPALAHLTKSFERARQLQDTVTTTCLADSETSAIDTNAMACKNLEAFMRAAVGGFESSATARNMPVHAEADAAVEDFMRELEQWSIEVQRHCAEDWNQCAAVLVRCLSLQVRSQKQRHQTQFDI
jgi:hypothetical protein